MSKAVFCIAKTETQAVAIVDRLRASGFSNNDISVLFPDKSGTKDFAHEQHTKAPEGAATGAGTGGVLGGAIGRMRTKIFSSFLSFSSLPIFAPFPPLSF